MSIGTYVLVVDDEAVVLDLMTEQLAAHGFEVLGVQSVDAALQALESEPPCLVLTDVQMEPQDGYALLESVSRTHSGLPVILMSSFALSQSGSIAERAGARGFLRKPFTETELLHVIRSALEPD